MKPSVPDLNGCCWILLVLKKYYCWYPLFSAPFILSSRLWEKCQFLNNYFSCGSRVKYLNLGGTWLPQLSCLFRSFKVFHCFYFPFVCIFGPPNDWDPFCSPFGSFWAPVGSLWAPFGSLLFPFGSFRAPVGSLQISLSPFWLPLVSFWLPLGSLRVPFGPFWFPFGSRSLPSDPSGSLLFHSGSLWLPLTPFWFPLAPF